MELQPQMIWGRSPNPVVGMVICQRRVKIRYVNWQIFLVHKQSITLRKTPFFKENQGEFKTLRIGYGMLIECSKIKSNQNRIIEEENDVVGNKFAMGKQQF